MSKLGAVSDCASFSVAGWVAGEAFGTHLGWVVLGIWMLRRTKACPGGFQGQKLRFWGLTWRSVGCFGLGGAIGLQGGRLFCAEVCVLQQGRMLFSARFRGQTSLDIGFSVRGLPTSIQVQARPEPGCSDRPPWRLGFPRAEQDFASRSKPKPRTGWRSDLYGKSALPRWRGNRLACRARLLRLNGF